MSNLINQENCIMPEMPYCPTCKYGSVVHDEESDAETTEWVCLYDPKDPQVFAL